MENDSTEMKKWVDSLNQRHSLGLVIITSNGPFDEFRNQRNINLAKNFAAQDWIVFFTSLNWLRTNSEAVIGLEVQKNIFQIPFNLLQEQTPLISQINPPQKLFILEFPHPKFLPCAMDFKQAGYTVIYDIIDEWEEFRKLNRIPWYDREIEAECITRADFVCAVSRPLQEKFSHLRSDIFLSPNGYNPALLGVVNYNIARQKPASHHQIQLGFFGHLTADWFDWQFLAQVLESSRTAPFELIVHLIGFEEPDLAPLLAQFDGRLIFYGRLSPAALYQHAGGWDAGLICFKDNKLSEAVDPIKIYEYLYFGLPVIAKGIGHLTTYPATRVVTSANETLQVLQSIYAAQQAHVPVSWNDEKVVAQFLSQCSWDQRVTDMIRNVTNASLDLIE